MTRLGMQITRYVTPPLSLVTNALSLIIFARMYRAKQQRASICTRRRINSAIISIVIIAALVTSYELYYYALTGPPWNTCYVPWDIQRTFNQFRLAIQYVTGMILPYFLIAVFNVLIIIHMAKYRRLRANMSANMDTKSDDSAQRSLTIMLVIVSCYSIFTTFPRLVAVGVNPMSYLRITVHQYYYYRWAVDIVAPWNYCGNFFFYVLSEKQFRQELLRMFCCRGRLSALGSKTRNTDMSSEGSSNTTASSVKGKPVSKGKTTSM